MLISGALDVLVLAPVGMPRKLRWEEVQGRLLLGEAQIACLHQALDEVLPEDQEADHQLAPCCKPYWRSLEHLRADCSESARRKMLEMSKMLGEYIQDGDLAKRVVETTLAKLHYDPIRVKNP